MWRIGLRNFPESDPIHALRMWQEKVAVDEAVQFRNEQTTE